MPENDIGFCPRSRDRHPVIGLEIRERIAKQDHVRSHQFAEAVFDLGDQNAAARGRIEVGQAENVTFKPFAIRLDIDGPGRREITGDDHPMRRFPGDGVALRRDLESRIALLVLAAGRVEKIQPAGQFGVGMDVRLPLFIHFGPFPDAVMRAGFRDGYGPRRRGLRGNADG